MNQLCDIQKSDPAPMEMAGGTASRSRWLGWAIFLGMSWTWCIGMYLPVLLLRDLGFAGFIVFAIPNVVGAAAMGWILRGENQSRELVAQHSTACIAFSAVTIAFHVYFATWIIRPLAGVWTVPAIAAAICAFCIAVTRGIPAKLLAAFVTLCVSVFAISILLLFGKIPHVIEHSNAALPQSDIIYLAPACLFGFLLCPYLDLTFHEARQAMNAHDSRKGFTVGFGIFFLAMIVFTAAYSGWLNVPIDRMVGYILTAYFITQSGFKMATHAQTALSVGKSRWGIIPALYGAAGFSLALGFLDLGAQYHGLSIGEIIYRCFLGFYGVAFPAYVWLCMMRPQRTLAVAAIAVLIAAPMFWMAFIEQKMFWLAPGIAIALLAKLIPSPRHATAV